MKELIRFSLHRRFFNKIQIFINLIIFTACGALLFADHFIEWFVPDLLKPIPIHTVGISKQVVEELNENNQIFHFYVSNQSVSKAMEKHENVLSYQGDYTIHRTYPLDELKTISLESLLNQYHQKQILKENPDSQALLAYTSGFSLKQDIKINHKKDEKQGIVFMIITSIYFMMLSFATTVANEVVYEKSTKTLELILTSVSAKVHFISKLLSGWLTILLQCGISISCFLFWFIIRWQLDNGSSLLKAGRTLQIITWEEKNFSQLLSKIDFSFDFFIIFLGIGIFLLIGMLFVQMILVVISSFISNIEAAGTIQAPFYMLLIAAYYLTLSLNNPQQMSNGIGYYLSFFPFLSMLMMPCRFMLSTVTIPEFLLALLFALSALWMVLRYGGSIYQRGVLDYSNKGFIQIVKSIFTHS